MKHQLSGHQTWVQALLAMVYMPMVARKIGRFPLESILGGLPFTERMKVRQGLEALVEMQILVLDRGEICITNMSEALFQGLDNLALGTVEEVAESLREASKFASLLTKLDQDPRLSPPGG